MALMYCQIYYDNVVISKCEGEMYHLPDLKDVVFRHATHHPRLVGVPSKVGNLRRVPSVYELHREHDVR